MRSPMSILSLLVAKCLVDSVLTLPVPQGGYGKPINNDDVPGIPDGPTGVADSVYGSEALLGHDSNPVNTADTTQVSPYSMVPGQEADADLGLYLDFTNAPNPQPIRGQNGATDPGPSKSIFKHLKE